MKIVKLDTFLANSGLRNYLFVRLVTDTGVTGVGEASLEWQERTVQTLIHEWLEDRILGADPADHERVVDALIRDQYQGGPTVMTAISSVEIAFWDILGKDCGRPVFELLGGRCRDRLPAYANGWYGGACTPAQYAEAAREVMRRGYPGLKLDPFGTAWREMTEEQMDAAEAIVGAVRSAIGSDKDLLIEGHGRLSPECAIWMGRRLEKYHPAFFEEPVSPYDWDGLLAVRRGTNIPLAAGERIYAEEEFLRFIRLGAVSVLQPDLSHCGGLRIGRRIAGAAAQAGIRLSPHVSVGPVALCAALHFGFSSPGVWMQENFSEYDVPWRHDLVCGWNPVKAGGFVLSERPGLGIELDLDAIARHPYRKHSFPSLWDNRWLQEFTQKDRSETSHA